MGSAVTIALIGSKDVGVELGKKGTFSDITLYNSVRDGRATTYVEPTQFPEKFSPLLIALAMADQVLLFVSTLTREVAEAAATADLFAKPVSIVTGPAVGEEELTRALRGLSLANAPRIPFDLPKLREEVERWTTPRRDGFVMVRIDHAFPVKGVGSVALGIVGQGTLRAHDRLRLYPTEKIVEVRSIQVHDVDVKEAETGERVGLALKGVDPEELLRGQTLAPEGSLSVSTELVGRSLTRCPYYRGELAKGFAFHLLVGLQFVPARLGAIEGESVHVEPDRPVASTVGESAYLADLSASPGPRIVAGFTL